MFWLASRCERVLNAPYMSFFFLSLFTILTHALVYYNTRIQKKSADNVSVPEDLESVT